METIRVFGDSILKGVQVQEGSGRYIVKDNLGYEVLGDKLGMNVQNFSKFGCTVTKAWSYIQHVFEKATNGGLVLMDFGGNDSDYNWQAIASDPQGEHGPNTDMVTFVDTYGRMLNYVREQGATPVMMNLPPISGERYFNWFCSSLHLDSSRVMAWLKDKSRIDRTQEQYSQAVVEIAKDMDVPMIDVRSAFYGYGDVDSLLCKDGIHPNSKGQAIIHDCLDYAITDYLSF